MLYRFRLFLVFWLGMAAFAVAQEPLNHTSPQAQAKQIWQLLDYIAIDYAGAVANGQVIQSTEYAEMQEFGISVENQLQNLTSVHQQPLLLKATKLRQLIAAKTAPITVAQAARSLASDVQQTYPFVQSPSIAPDVTKGMALFQANCAACHGTQGRGDGPLAASLEPRPTDFTDRVRARERSPFALYQVITQGVSGTAMSSFASLSENERWTLAFFVGTLAATPEEVALGKDLWQNQERVREGLPSLDVFAQTSEQALIPSLSSPKAHAVMAYLRTEPGVLVRSQSTGTALARAKLAESMTALEQGNIPRASQLALSAYLDGFEPIEPALATRNRPLFLEIETAMMTYRNHIAQESLSKAQATQRKLQTLLHQADSALEQSQNDAGAVFLGAFTILLREGLEALLVVVGMLTFLRKTERGDVAKYVHAGWVSALAAGGLTWGIATYLVSISGASRELTEGLSALFAAVILLAVGIWMHQKSLAGRWQAYLKEKLSVALNQRTIWFLFSLSFIAVYREVFETILFYAALWREGNESVLLAGLGTGVISLMILAYFLIRSSAHLPIGQFFRLSSLLVAVLAVIMAGKGVAAIQEAGWLSITPMPFPRIEWVGIYPSWQPVAVQLGMLIMILISFGWQFRSARSVSRTTLSEK